MYTDHPQERKRKRKRKKEGAIHYTLTKKERDFTYTCSVRSDFVVVLRMRALCSPQTFYFGKEGITRTEGEIEIER